MIHSSIDLKLCSYKLSGRFSVFSTSMRYSFTWPQQSSKSYFFLFLKGMSPAKKSNSWGILDNITKEAYQHSVLIDPYSMIFGTKSSSSSLYTANFAILMQSRSLTIPEVLLILSKYNELLVANGRPTEPADLSEFFHWLALDCWQCQSWVYISIILTLERSKWIDSWWPSNAIYLLTLKLQLMFENNNSQQLVFRSAILQ